MAYVQVLFCGIWKEFGGSLVGSSDKSFQSKSNEFMGWRLNTSTDKEILQTAKQGV